jgi:hypothetical protein
MEGRGHILNQGIISAFFWKNWEIPKETPLSIFVSLFSYSDALDQDKKSSIFSPTEDGNSKFQNVV